MRLGLCRPERTAAEAIKAIEEAGISLQLQNHRCHATETVAVLLCVGEWGSVWGRQRGVVSAACQRRGRGTHLVVNVATDPGHQPPLGVGRERRECALLQADTRGSDGAAAREAAGGGAQLVTFGDVERVRAARVQLGQVARRHRGVRGGERGRP